MTKQIIHVFDIAASENTVIKSLNTLEGLRAWWSKDVTGSTQVGEILEFRFADVFKPDMKVTQSNNTVVEWKCVGGEKEWDGSTFSFSISNSGKHSKLTFIQSYGIEVSDEVYGRFNFNWGYYLHSLKIYCETGTGKPWVNKSNQ